ncbi:MAG: T9SS type A sorting domain-containing protein [Bacteroidota bacterium]
MYLFLRTITVSFLFLFLYSQKLQAQIFKIDPSFQPLLVKRHQGYLRHIIVQADQKILINGGYNFLNGQSSSGLNRMNPDGTLDTSFHLAPEVYSPLWLALRPDNQLVAASVFYNPNGKKAVTVFLLQSSGKMDSTYHTDVEFGDIFSARTFALHTDNTIIIGTNILEDNINRAIISRINTDGSTKTLYKNNTSNNSWVFSLQLQPDGKILANGTFPQADGTKKTLIRLNTDGSVDNSFDAPDLLYAQSITLLPNGKLLISQYSSILTRLNADGSVDNSFQTSPGNWNSIDNSLLQPDGTLLLNVWIEDKVNYNGGHATVVKLHEDGTLDTLFKSGEGASEHSIELLARQANGDVLVGGLFNKYNGKTNVSLVRLKGGDGSLDTTFLAKIESSGHVKPVLKQPDGKIIVGGSFDKANDYHNSYITRLNPDGKRDTTLNIGTGVDGFWEGNRGSLNALALQTDNRILVGGYFKSFNGTPTNALLRLNQDGTIDLSFTFAITDPFNVNAILVQPDGKIVISGDRQSSIEPTKMLFRLNTDGSLDPGFQTGNEFDNRITKIIAQPDGKLLIVGDFTSINGKPAGNLTRLLADGTPDETFIATGASGGLDFTTINAVVLQPDNKILVGGSFTHFNGTEMNKIARLKTDGSIDLTFKSSISIDSEVSSIVVRPDGRLFISGILFNLSNNVLNGLTSTGGVEFSVFLFDDLSITLPDLLVSGNDLILSGSNRLVRLTRELVDQAITFAPIPDQLTSAQPFTINASVNSLLPLTLTLVSGPATLSGNTVTLKGDPGKVTIRASQAGDDFMRPAPAVERSFMVNAILGVEKSLDQAITLFPNPTSRGEFTISLPASTHKATIQLLNTQGQPVLTSLTPLTHGIIIKPPYKLSGMYIVRVKLGDQEIYKKVIFE